MLVGNARKRQSVSAKYAPMRAFAAPAGRCSSMLAKQAQAHCKAVEKRDGVVLRVHSGDASCPRPSHFFLLFSLTLPSVVQNKKIK